VSEHKTVVVIPALNEEQTIANVIRNVKKYADEVIVVDDASKDQTPVIAIGEGAVVFSHAQNEGYDKSIEDGFYIAVKRKATIVVTFDADGQHCPEEIPMMVQPIIDDEADVVVGNRPYHARIAEYLYALMGKLKANLDDPLCGLKAYNIEVYKDIGYFDKITSIGTQLVFNAVKNGYRVVQRDIKLNARTDSPRFGRRIKGNFKLFKAILNIACWDIKHTLVREKVKK